MPDVGIIQSEFLINGSFGTLKDQDGNVYSEVQKIDAKIALAQTKVMRAGTRRVGYKASTVEGTGTLQVYHVTSRFLKLMAQMMGSDSQLQDILQLTVSIDDPESLGVESYILNNVKFWDIPLGFDVNTLLQETLTFTFEGFTPISWISGDPTVSQHAAKYSPLY